MSLDPETAAGALAWDPRSALSSAQAERFACDAWLRSAGRPPTSMPLSSSQLLQGPVDEGALASALAEVVHAHEALCTRFVAAGDDFRRDVAPECELRILRDDVSGLGPEERRQAVEQLFHELSKPFDLDRAPAMRVALLRSGPDERILLIVAEHLVTDGVSQAVLLGELGRAYSGAPTGEARGRPFSDFVAHEREVVDSREGEAVVEHWRETLDGVTFPPFVPPGFNIPEWPGNAHVTSIATDENVARRLADTARRCHTTPFAVLGGALMTAMHAWAPASSQGFVSPVANRGMRGEFEDCIGYLTNSIVVTAEVTPALAFGEWVRRAVHPAVIAGLVRQEYPHTELTRRLDPCTYGRTVAAPHISFMYVERAMAEPTLTICDVRAVPLALRSRNESWIPHPIGISVTDGTAGIEIIVLFQGAGNRELVERFSQGFTRVLEAALRDPALPIGGLAPLALA